MNDLPIGATICEKWPDVRKMCEDNRDIQLSETRDESKSEEMSSRRNNK